MSLVIATFARVDQIERFVEALYRQVRLDAARATMAPTPDPDTGLEVAVVVAPHELAARARQLVTRMGGLLHEP